MRTGLLTLALVFALSAAAWAGELELAKGLNTEATPATLCRAEVRDEGLTLAGRGCCSHHKGQCGCEGGRVVCCDGSLSPSCRCEKDEGAVNLEQGGALTDVTPI